MLKMRKGCPSDLEAVLRLYRNCITDLEEKGLYQWDNRYPNRETFEKSINEGSLYLFPDGNSTLAGSVILNEIQSREWAPVKWNYRDGKILVIHALAVDPACRGLGYGRLILNLCEEFGRRNRYGIVRLDVFPENKAAVALYRKNGYRKAGEVVFPFKPEDHQVYDCYEKILG